jgi:uncharacterized membrane protein YccC
MFSLRMLIALVTLCAVYIAGMVYRTEWWEASLLMLTYLIFAAALTAAILSHERRAFFAAFAVFGLGYGMCLYAVMGHAFITDTLLWRFADRLARPVDELQENGQHLGEAVALPPNPFDDSSNPFRPVDRGPLYFVHIGHAFVAVLISCLAGIVADSLVRKKSKSSLRA